MSIFNKRVKAHLSTIPAQLNNNLARTFRDDHVVQLEHLLPADLADAMRDQASRLINNHARRRDVTLEATGGTPRAYLSVGRDQIHAENGIITEFFESDIIRGYLSDIAGETLHKVPYAPEEYIVNSQAKSGDTHGWHWDDYTFALIWVVDAPGATEGGRVEFVPRTQWDKKAPRAQLEKLLTNEEIRSRYIKAGTCYLMRANTTLHRISPLSGDTQRTVIVFTFASDADLVDDTISHETMEEIYHAEIVAA